MTVKKNMTTMQRHYWNDLADHYQRSTEIVDTDFHYGPEIPGERDLQLLPPLQSGMSALELGCGAAQNSIWLARRGIVCTAVDIAAKQLTHARAAAKRAKVQIRLHCAPIEEFHKLVRGSFDLIHSSHALEFIDDPERCLRLMARRLNSGGHLVFSTVHPLYNGEWVEQADTPENDVEMGLFVKSYFKPPDDVRRRGRKIVVISRAYPVSAWFNWLRAAGLAIVRLEEPPAVAYDVTPPYTNRAWHNHEGELHAIPGTLILVARKGSE